ncbi:MAG: septal ring lytic transglycosylase RlpA family protein [Candidatus Melainabacteria bacterium]|nr:septal ring lytic transglycosylase RlpA family protein [Candidatus Melainabacteria bacterium]
MRASHLVSITALAALSLVLTVSGVSAEEGKPGGKSASKRFSGLAHFYADRLHGKKTASGQPHDREELVAAHRTLPFGTRVKVKNKRNGRSCVVRINDRGPFGKGVIDVSRAAARELGFVSHGNTVVDCAVVTDEEPEITL